jgi:hypothetical protein
MEMDSHTSWTIGQLFFIRISHFVIQDQKFRQGSGDNKYCYDDGQRTMGKSKIASTQGWRSAKWEQKQKRVEQ